ncbi:MAG: hypothetical protein ACWGPN_08935 [Gammaproteobacteria bacterium]
MELKKLLALTTCTALAAPGMALAQEGFDYRYFEVGFVDVEIDDTSIDGDGIRLEGLHEFGDSFFLSAKYEDYDFDFDIDGSSLQIGGGYIHPFSADLHFVAKGQYAQVEVNNYDDDGIGIGGGVRTRLTDTIEVDAMLNWFDFDDGGSDTYIDLRGRYYINQRFAVSLSFDIGSDYFETMGVGVRFEL